MAAVSLFISDLHLDGERPQITRLFGRFLADEARQAERLFILGDLFEAWVGDDDPSPLAAEVAQGLKHASETGTEVFLVHGNRDFLMRDGFARRAGAQLLEPQTVIDLGGVPTLVCHGDELCTDDEDYQRFRQMVRDPQWQAEFLSRPLAERRAAAEQMRERSRTETAVKREDIMDVNQSTVEQTLLRHGVHRVIHGHTHRPGRHRFKLNGLSAERLVLGDWYEQGSVLRGHRDGTLELARLDPDPA